MWLWHHHITATALLVYTQTSYWNIESNNNLYTNTLKPVHSKTAHFFIIIPCVPICILFILNSNSISMSQIVLGRRCPLSVYHILCAIVSHQLWARSCSISRRWRRLSHLLAWKTDILNTICKHVFLMIRVRGDYILIKIWIKRYKFKFCIKQCYTITA